MSVGVQTVRRLLATRAASRMLRPVMRDRASIFMLHRFAVPDLGIVGDDPAHLRGCLATLRREGYDFIALDRLFDDLRHGRRQPRPVVAFTIDDGYADQARVGAPVFAEFDCPVTTFVTSGFLDGALWFWWDRIEYVFEHTARRALEVPLGDRPLHYAWNTPDERLAAQAAFTTACKLVPDAVKLAAIEALARAAEVELPVTPPARYEPMSWDELRAAERGGMSFGPHTVTHPVLSRATDAQSRFELDESWRRLAAEAARPVHIFCYPNGKEPDFTDREVANLKALDYTGAVTGISGHAERLDGAAGRPADPYRVRRFNYVEDMTEIRLCVNGADHLVERLQGR